MYKAILNDNGDFEVIQITNEEAIGLTESVYSFYEKGVSGIFAIRETAKNAINALKKDYNIRIMEKEMQLNVLKEQLKIIEAYEQI